MGFGAEFIQSKIEGSSMSCNRRAQAKIRSRMLFCIILIFGIFNGGCKAKGKPGESQKGAAVKNGISLKEAADNLLKYKSSSNSDTSLYLLAEQISTTNPTQEETSNVASNPELRNAGLIAYGDVLDQVIEDKIDDIIDAETSTSASLASGENMDLSATVPLFVLGGIAAVGAVVAGIKYQRTGSEIKKESERAEADIKAHEARQVSENLKKVRENLDILEKLRGTIPERFEAASKKLGGDNSFAKYISERPENYKVERTSLDTLKRAANLPFTDVPSEKVVQEVRQIGSAYFEQNQREQLGAEKGFLRAFAEGNIGSLVGSHTLLGGKLSQHYLDSNFMSLDPSAQSAKIEQVEKLIKSEIENFEKKVELAKSANLNFADPLLKQEFQYFQVQELQNRVKLLNWEYNFIANEIYNDRTIIDNKAKVDKLNNLLTETQAGYERIQSQLDKIGIDVVDNSFAKASYEELKPQLKTDYDKFTEARRTLNTASSDAKSRLQRAEKVKAGQQRSRKFSGGGALMAGISAIVMLGAGAATASLASGNPEAHAAINLLCHPQMKEIIEASGVTGASEVCKT